MIRSSPSRRNDQLLQIWAPCHQDRDVDQSSANRLPRYVPISAGVCPIHLRRQPKRVDVPKQTRKSTYFSCVPYTFKNVLRLLSASPPRMAPEEGGVRIVRCVNAGKPLPCRTPLSDRVIGIGMVDNILSCSWGEVHVPSSWSREKAPVEREADELVSEGIVTRAIVDAVVMILQ